MLKKNQREIVKEGLPLIGAVTTGERWEKGIFPRSERPRASIYPDCHIEEKSHSKESL